MQKTVYHIFYFITGVFVAYIVEPYVRDFVISLYIWSTNGTIEFHGKPIFIMAHPLYYLSAGIAEVVLTNRWNQANFYTCILKFSFYLLRVTALLILFSVAVAHGSIWLCKDCTDGVRSIQYSLFTAEYGLIAALAIIAPCIPYIFDSLRKRRHD